MEIEKLDAEASMEEENGGVKSSNGKEAALLASDLSKNLDLHEDEDEKENNQEKAGSKGKPLLVSD